MQEYLKKTIANQRTGANIVGISLDNLDLINFSDDFKTTFETVQGFAKKVDDLNLKNEQEMFRVNLRKRQLEFEQKYAGQDVYNNDDTYKQFMEDYKQLKIQSEEEIQQFKFLTPQEKQIFLKDYQNDYQTDYVKFLDKRNQAEIKKGVNKSIMLIDGIKENLKLEDLSDRTALRKGIDKISSCYDDMIKVGYMDTYTKTIKLADDISETETAMLERQVNEEVIYGTKYTTVEEKKQALKNIQAHLTNPTRINDTVDTIIKTYKLEDTEEIRNYVSGKLKGSYKDMEIKLDKQLYKIETQKTTEEKLKKMYDKEQNKENLLKQAIEDKDNFKVAQLKEGYDLTTSEMVSPEYSYILQENYGVDMSNFGDEKNPLVGRVVSDKGIKEINNLIFNLKSDKTIEIDTKTIVENIIYPYAKKNSNAKYQQTAILKDLGNRIKGINTTVLLKGKEKPIYFDVWDTLSKGDANSVKFANNGAFMGYGKGKLNFDRLWKELGGTTKARNALAQYLVGIVNNSEDPYVTEYVKAGRYNDAIETYLKNEFNYTNIDQDILQALRDIKISPINYKEADLNPYERKIKPLENKTIRKEEKEVENGSKKSVS